MRRLIVPVAVALSAGFIAFAMFAGAQEPPKNSVTVYMTTDLTGDPTREVVLQSVTFPPGGDTGRHRHPGDEYLMVQEGEILHSVDGEASRTLKAGDSLHTDPGIVHRNQNVSNKPARAIEVFIVAKGKPRLEHVQ